MVTCRRTLLRTARLLLRMSASRPEGTVSVHEARAMSTQTVTSPPECLMKPMNFPFKTLMGPGPSNCPPRVLNASALPMLGHLHPEFTQIMDEVKAGIQYAFQTGNQWTVCISATGHGAMEAAAANLLEAGDVVLVCENGLWGQRFAEMAQRHDNVKHARQIYMDIVHYSFFTLHINLQFGLKCLLLINKQMHTDLNKTKAALHVMIYIFVDLTGAVVAKLLKPMGTVFTLEDIENGLKEHQPKVMFITHGESSGTTVQPLPGIGDLCHRHDCLLLVDSVAAMGGVPLFMDAWGIDVMYTGAQKVLSAPPGASPISFSDRARKRVQSRKTPPRSYYFDMNQLANYWDCDGEARRYHHTGPISSVYAIREGLARLADVSLEKSWEIHSECAEMLQTEIENLGLKLFVKDKDARLPCITGVLVPEGVNWKQVSDFAMENYRVEISGGLAAMAGKMWRIGLMGYNCTPDNVRLVVRALKHGLEHVGFKTRGRQEQ